MDNWKTPLLIHQPTQTSALEWGRKNLIKIGEAIDLARRQSSDGAAPEFLFYLREAWRWVTLIKIKEGAPDTPEERKRLAGLATKRLNCLRATSRANDRKNASAKTAAYKSAVIAEGNNAGRY